MKYIRFPRRHQGHLSPPVWGAWVEIVVLSSTSSGTISRPPCGGRGLKSLCDLPLLRFPGSPPVWGAWVEIRAMETAEAEGSRPPCGGRGLKSKRKKR